MGSEEWAVYAGTVLYATRPTQAEAERVRDDQYNLAKKFGLPVVVRQTVVSMEKRRG